ncbi:penicillin-insensitive murein endopeptidase [Phytomonospora sp. NPDC050363]|uniref:penicillin-insensitive murein endopeptidase n=1 Tax=Phytomonospora sp. NPDC050363 TaxID=3155642 RepID=UPI0033E0C78B
MSRHLRALLIAITCAIALVVTATPAVAYPNAYFHTQSAGNRGADVQAIQYLLQHHGQSASADGVFGSGTTAAVRAFQTAKGLGVDGIVGPQTWAALAPQIQQGANGPAVRALQVQLNAKRRLSLAVDGVFGAAVTTAVRDFQSHAGIGVDGVVGPTTWRNLAWHYDYPDFAAGLCNQNPDGNTSADWGTAAAIGQLEAAARTFAGTGQGQIPVGDIGWEHGGAINGHSSHRVGLDADLWPIRTDNAQCSAGRITWQSATYDRAATRQLVQAIRAAAPGHVALIFFNDPTLISEGLTSQYANHDNHLHVRYCEKVEPNSLYDC